MSKPDTRGYAPRMCSSLWFQVGGLLALCRILLQQKLSVEFEDGLFEALYGQKCRTPLNRSQTGEGKIFGPDVLKEAEAQVQLIRECLKTAQSH